MKNERTNLISVIEYLKNNYSNLPNHIFEDLGEIKDDLIKNSNAQNKIHKQIEKLIPFISENFITYPLWEEGKYIPFINFWQKAESRKKCKELDKKIEALCKDTGYCVNIQPKDHVSVIHKYYIYPAFEDTEDGSYKFINKNWSIEEMLDLLEKFLKDK